MSDIEKEAQRVETQATEVYNKTPVHTRNTIIGVVVIVVLGILFFLLK